MTDTVTEAMIEAGDAVLKRRKFSWWETMEEAEGHDLIAAIYLAMRSASPVDTGVDDLRAKFRNVVSHATGGSYSEPEDVDRSLNDICVEISRHRNEIWKQAQKSALKDIASPVDGEVVERVIDETVAELKVPPSKRTHPDDRVIIRAEQKGYDILAYELKQRLAALTAMKENDRG